jgi:hypothetical protein
MPLYVYRCPEGHEAELFRSYSQIHNDVTCNECLNPMHWTPTAPNRSYNTRVVLSGDDGYDNPNRSMV